MPRGKSQIPGRRPAKDLPRARSHCRKGTSRMALSLEAPSMTRKEGRGRALLTLSVCSSCVPESRWKASAQVSEMPVGRPKGLMPGWSPFSTPLPITG